MTTLVDGIAEDFYLFDGIVPLTVEFSVTTATPDFATGTIDPIIKSVTTTGLIRQLANRDNKSVQSIRTSMTQMQNDEFHTIDTIIELPDIPELAGVCSGGTVISGNIRYKIIAADTCTLRTRIRVGARRLL